MNLLITTCVRGLACFCTQSTHAHEVIATHAVIFTLREPMRLSSDHNRAVRFNRDKIILLTPHETQQCKNIKCVFTYI